MLNLPDDLHQNHLLAALPPSELRTLIPYLRPVYLKSGQLLSDSGQTIKPGHALLTWLEPDDAHEPALMAEAALAEDWLNPEEDVAWAHLQPGK